MSNISLSVENKNNLEVKLSAGQCGHTDVLITKERRSRDSSWLRDR